MLNNLKIIIYVIPNSNTVVELHESSVIRVFSRTMVQLHGSSVALWFSCIVVQLHCSSVVRRFSYTRVELHGASIKWGLVARGFSCTGAQLHGGSDAMEPFFHQQVQLMHDYFLFLASKSLLTFSTTTYREATRMIAITIGTQRLNNQCHL